MMVLGLLSGCRHRQSSDFWIWVPGGKAKEAKIRSLVQEMGIPARFVDSSELLASSPRTLRNLHCLMVFEGPGTEMLGNTGIREMLAAGGSLLLAGDSASFLESELGFQIKTVTPGPMLWQEPARERLAPGSFSAKDGTAQVYGYAARILGGWLYQGLSAEAWAKDTQGVLRWAEKPFGKGRIVMAGLPLATMATEGDSLGAWLLLNRAVELGSLPQLWPTPAGKGAVAVNVHVDALIHLGYLPDLLVKWPKNIRATWHITAGPDRDQEGDGLGVRVSDPTKGGLWVKRLKGIGEIGSHGGWIHNLWAAHAGQWPKDQQERLLQLNYDALKPFGSLTSYSSPSGNHPESINGWLVNHGIRAVYFTGENGLPPTHPWINGRPWGQSMWAFPVTTDGPYASCYEYRAAGLTQDNAKAWLDNVVNFCDRTRALRLVYGHSVEWGDFPEAYYTLLNRLSQKVQNGHMTARTMTDYTEFLERHQAVKWSFRVRQGQGYLKADGASLKEMAFRLPGVWKLNTNTELRSRVEAGWTWVEVLDNRTRLDVKLTR